jgi:hypothetical protein
VGSPKVVGTVCRARSVFEVFDDLDRNLAQFVELRVFCKCDQFLVPCMCGIYPKLTEQTFKDLDPPGFLGTESLRILRFFSDRTELSAL